MKINGSRTRIRSLYDSMILVLKEAHDINQSLEDLGDDTEGWMHDIKFQTDNIKSQIDEYLELRKDCLLYTSPSPRDRTRSRMPSSA